MIDERRCAQSLADLLASFLIGLGIAIYQLWSADKAQEQGEHSALAARFGGKRRSRPVDHTNDPNPHVPAFDQTRAANQ